MHQLTDSMTELTLENSDEPEKASPSIVKMRFESSDRARMASPVENVPDRWQCPYPQGHRLLFTDRHTNQARSGTIIEDWPPPRKFTYACTLKVRLDDTNEIAFAKLFDRSQAKSPRLEFCGNESYTRADHINRDMLAGSSLSAELSTALNERKQEVYRVFKERARGLIDTDIADNAYLAALFMYTRPPSGVIGPACWYKRICDKVLNIATDPTSDASARLDACEETVSLTDELQGLSVAGMAELVVEYCLRQLFEKELDMLPRLERALGDTTARYFGHGEEHTPWGIISFVVLDFIDGYTLRALEEVYAASDEPDHEPASPSVDSSGIKSVAAAKASLQQRIKHSSSQDHPSTQDPEFVSELMQMSIIFHRLLSANISWDDLPATNVMMVVREQDFKVMIVDAGALSYVPGGRFHPDESDSLEILAKCADRTVDSRKFARRYWTGRRNNSCHGSSSRFLHSLAVDAIFGSSEQLVFDAQMPCRVRFALKLNDSTSRIYETGSRKPKCEETWLKDFSECWPNASNRPCSPGSFRIDISLILRLV